MATIVVLRKVIHKVNRKAYLGAYLRALSIYATTNLYKTVQNTPLRFPKRKQLRTRNRALLLAQSFVGGLVLVPNVVGLTANAAQTAIGAVLLTPSATFSYSVSVPVGFVISQNPSAGRPVAIGTVVAYVVSLGPPVNPPYVPVGPAPAGTAAVPNLIGMFYYDAQLAILGAGFRIAPPVWIFAPPGVNPQYVVSQSSPAGAFVALGTEIVIDVAGFTVINQPNTPTPVP